MTYSVRRCRGHYHVHIEGLGDVEFGKAFATEQEAQKRADELNAERTPTPHAGGTDA